MARVQWTLFSYKLKRKEINDGCIGIITQEKHLESWREVDFGAAKDSKCIGG